MIARRLTSILEKRLSQTPVVALLGSRQVGKTTLARGLDAGKPSHYLDLERPSDVAKLADPELKPGDMEKLMDKQGKLQERIDASNAWDQGFYAGGQLNSSKTFTNYVRAVRAF